jgi:HTH-type transcriptional regulator/antitoxin HigA
LTAGHILLHSKQKTAVFLDDPAKGGSNSMEEQEANMWARDRLFPPTAAQELAALPHNRTAVVGFAAKLGIHPGIVVGRMQHDRVLDVTWLNDLKVSFQFSK